MIAGNTDTRNQPSAGTLVAVKNIVPLRSMLDIYLGNEGLQVPGLQSPEDLELAQK